MLIVPNMKAGLTWTSAACIVSLLIGLIGGASCLIPSAPLRLKLNGLNGVRYNNGVRPHAQTMHKAASSKTTRSTLSMHMGHSHAHHDHHEVSSSKTASKVPVWAKRRRIAALLLFCAMAILGPPLARHRALSNKDVAAFLVTSTSLFLLEPIRDQVKHTLGRIRQLGDGISRHSGPISPRYFFKNESAADRVTLMGAIVNLFLSAGKFFVGVSCHSSALVADAGHSLSDLFSDFITLWAVNVGRLPPDEDHPYGHGKFEAIGSLFLSLTLFGTGIGVGAVSNKRLLEILSMQRGLAGAAVVAVPKLPALLMAGLSIVSKEWLFRITRDVGERLNSQIVIANAWHHRSDAYSSVLALGSIALAMYVPGLVFVDAAAGLFVAGMICMTGAEILGESIKQLTDTSNDELVERITALAAKSDDVMKVNRVRARQVGSSSTVDVSVSMPDDRSASAARAVEARLKQRIMQEDGVLDVDVRATSPEVFCPLLEASNVNPVSAAEVEACVRDELLSRHPEVKSIEGIVVHYQDTFIINVDVHIRLATDTSIGQANSLATGLRETLESSSQISKAKIFLDLNQDVTSPQVA